MPETMKTADGLYRSDKAAFHAERLQAMHEGRQPYPVHVQIVLSDLCNQDCAFCAYRIEGYSSNQLFNDPQATVPRNPNRMLPAETVMRVLDDCRAMGVKAIQLTGGGEPTIHAAFDQVVKGVLDHGIQLALVTNGSLLDRTTPWLQAQGTTRIAQLAQAAWVRISLDAATPENYSRVRRVPAKQFDVVLENTRRLAADIARQGSACRLGIGFVVTPDNYLELPQAIDVADALGVDNIRISAAFTPAGYKHHEAYAARVRAMIGDAKAAAWRSTFTIYDNFGDRIEDLELRHPDYAFCPIMRLQTYLGGDGYVYTCCINAYNRRGQIGSFVERGFKALWDSPQKRTFFEGFDARHCPACMYNPKNRFMNALIARGNIHAPSEPPPEHVDFI